jgi:hypothetical protein
MLEVYMKKLFLVMLLCAGSLMAQETTKWDRLYTISHISLATTAGLDLWTSQRSVGVPGTREANPLFRTSTGAYNPHLAIPVKIGVHSGYYWLHSREVKKEPRFKKQYAIINFVVAGFLGYTAINNYRVVNNAKRRYNEFQ